MRVNLMFVVLLFVQFSCKKTSLPDSIREPSRLITMTELRSYWGDNDTANAFINYPVEVYPITFQSTDLEGNVVEAGGAVLFPVGADNPKVLSIQHATFFANEEAPSIDGNFSVVDRKSIFAANGDIVLLPDYLGYGPTSAYVHPYHHKRTLAQHTSDMLLAVREIIMDKGHDMDEIYLAGYSEGAYATLAATELLEQQGVEIKGISLGSGAYDLRSTVSSFISDPDQFVGCLACNAFFIYAYHHVYDLDRPLDAYFQSTYAAAIEEGLFNGDFNASEIAAALPSKTTDLFQSAFLERFERGEESALMRALEQNDLLEYRPKVPVLMFHGTEDTVAPFFNSENLAAELPADQVTFIPMEGVDHFEGIFNWGILTMQWLNKQ